VMYLGKIVEIAAAKELYTNPRTLHRSAPVRGADPRSHDEAQADPARRRRAEPDQPTSGCRFHTRCSLRVPSCSENEQVLKEVSPGTGSPARFALASLFASCRSGAGERGAP